MNTSYGASGDWFGHRDYTGNLKEIWDATPAGEERQRKLMQRRQDILSWMGDSANESKIKEHNRLGIAPRDDGSGGLGQRIASGNLSERFMGLNMDIDPETGAAFSEKSKNYFGHADLMHARASGHSWGDIQGYLDQNSSLLRDKNVKGGGGLYDEVATQSRFEHTTQENNKNWSNLIEGLQTSFDDSMTKQQDFQKAQLDWQSTESEAQRAHEAAMLAEQRKVKTATPTHVKNPISQLAIGPGKVAAPQSASSLARKRLGSAPLVTGLNIGSKKTSMNIK